MATSGFGTPRSVFSGVSSTRDGEYEDARDRLGEEAEDDGDEYRGRVMYRRDRRASTVTMDVDG